jgi:hypothetical protein
VLTHVPPLPEACWYDGKMSEPAWLLWFTCVATDELLRQYAGEHPGTRVTVLCGHTHGKGVFEVAPNLEVRTVGGRPESRGKNSRRVTSLHANDRQRLERLCRYEHAAHSVLASLSN